jgi:hypothetical protein
MSCCPDLQGDAVEPKGVERWIDGRNIRVVSVQPWFRSLLAYATSVWSRGMEVWGLLPSSFGASLETPTDTFHCLTTC